MALVPEVLLEDMKVGSLLEDTQEVGSPEEHAVVGAVVVEVAVSGTE